MPTKTNLAAASGNSLPEVVGRDFTLTYLATRDYHEFAKIRPAETTAEFIGRLAGVFDAAEHENQRNVRYLYRETGKALAAMLVPDTPPHLSARALAILMHTSVHGTVKQRLAVSQVLGELPLGLRGPELEPTTRGLEFSWGEALRLGDAKGPFETAGRSVLFARDDGGHFVIKLARENEDPAGLEREALWMERLAEMSAEIPVRFDVPQPFRICGERAFRLTDIPLDMDGLHPEGWAMGYFAPPGYFAYPNDDREGRLPAPDCFLEMMRRNSRILGHLAAKGILHTAPIPLFHNRVQQTRRNDLGLYEWHRMGRLDKWLESCRYPNFGESGLRDFEHLEGYRGKGPQLYRQVGTSLLSLALVAGSYFRAREPELVGHDENGQPIDARHLFDHLLLSETMRGVYEEFYHGFCGQPPTSATFDFDSLSERMIEEMGVDRFMREILRVEDQQEICRATFEDFLVSRGYTPNEAAAMPQGRKDITIQTGPHLGGFNQTISLPELIHFVASASGCIIAGRYLHTKLPGLA